MKIRHCVDLKVVLLGRHASGKTCLVDRFVNERFLGGDNDHQGTIGAAYAEKREFCPEVGKMVTIGFWDTAGGER